MAKTASIRWYGDQLLAQIRAGTPDALLEGAQELLSIAQSKVVRKSGDLHDSGYVATESKSTYVKKKIHNKEVKAPKGGALVGFAAFYAKFVEFGTKKMPMQPFLRPAIDEAKDKIGKKIVVSLGNKIK